MLTPGGLTPEDIQLIYEMKLAIAGLIEEVLEEKNMAPTHTFDFLDCSYDVIEIVPHCWAYTNHVEHKLIPYKSPEVANDHPNLN